MALRSFLFRVNQDWKPWVSQTDIRAGTAWRDELRSALKASSFGIVCADQFSLQSPWVHFEAGALSASISGGMICPYLIDSASKQDLSGGPLAEFQSVEATRHGTGELLRSIQLAFAGIAIPERDLQLRADDAWPALHDAINAAISDNAVRPSRPRYNCLDIDGFKSLLDMHLTATMGRLTFILDQALQRSDKQPIKKLMREVECNIRTEIIRRRSHLSRFYLDGAGRVVDILDKSLAINDIPAKLKKARKMVMEAPDKRRMIYTLILDEQARLENNLKELLKGF